MAHSHHHHSHSYDHVSGKKLSWTIVFNLLITIAEFVGGILTGYLALIADAIHNLSDVAALVLAWIGVKGARMPSTKKSTFGYLRIEVMTAFISAVSLVVIAIYILYEAYLRFINPVEIKEPILFLTIAVIGLIGNVVSILLLSSEKGKSLNMKSAFLHMAYDAVSSIVVIIGGILIWKFGIYYIDPILSAVIALMIFYSSYNVIKEAVLILLEAVPPGIDFDQVHNSILEISNVNDVHDLHIWSLSSNDTALSCHICIEKDNLIQSPQIIEDINKQMHDKFHIGHCTIQVETEDCPHPELLCQNQSKGNH